MRWTGPSALPELQALQALNATVATLDKTPSLHTLLGDV